MRDEVFRDRTANGMEDYAEGRTRLFARWIGPDYDFILQVE